MSTMYSADPTCLSEAWKMVTLRLYTLTVACAACLLIFHACARDYSSVFTARRYPSAVHAVVVCMSVYLFDRLSVCRKPALYQNG